MGQKITSSMFNQPKLRHLTKFMGVFFLMTNHQEFFEFFCSNLDGDFGIQYTLFPHVLKVLCQIWIAIGDPRKSVLTDLQQTLEIDSPQLDSYSLKI